ncbi:MAG TPA: class I SAM-dependent methyltransferase [Candidatus Saccharimonadales bacterium]|nr:class I SAM-dependent methyltransferase [Candidatus Saccharimonadales bacterium]
MIILALLAAALVIIFGFVLLFGAPYLPTLKKPRNDVFELLALKPGQVFVDLGCGDGRMLSAAAQRGYEAVGYELNPLLALYAWLRTRRYSGKVKVRCANFWNADISDADGVFVFLIGHFMFRLDKMISRQSGGKTIKLVSNAFEIPGKRPVKRKGGLYLYVYKAG